MMMERAKRLLLAGPALAVLAAGEAGVAIAAADTIGQKATICGACHGASGAPISKDIPVIWGEHAGYIFVELRDFQTGARKNQAMALIMKNVTRAEMLALAEYFEAKPWPDLDQSRAAADVSARAQAIAASGQCTQCHLDGYLGASVTPRLAGQSIEYLRRTMLDFKAGVRANNPWMTALLKTYTDADIDALAAYLGGLQ